MGLMLLSGVQDVFPMWLLLLGAIGLTISEGIERKIGVVPTLWWVLLVALTHVIGYLGMRLWFWRKGTEST